MRQPQAFMIAGPNGAGKSTYSSMFVKPGTIHFDGDKIIAQYEKQYPGLGDAALSGAVSNHFTKLIEKALTEKKDFAFETNFRDNEVMDVIKEFKKQGFETNLIHMALSSVSESFDRVNLRKGVGGHAVDDYSIKLNFEEGTKNLIKYAGQFDRSIIFDNSLNQQSLTALLMVQNGKVLRQHDPMPERHKQLIADVIKNLPEPPKQDLTKNKGFKI
jgi:predicted ABC-type ATPase